MDQDSKCTFVQAVGHLKFLEEDLQGPCQQDKGPVDFCAHVIVFTPGTDLADGNLLILYQQCQEYGSITSTYAPRVSR